MKLLNTILILPLLFLIGCSSQPDTVWYNDDTGPSRPDTNFMFITNFVENIVPICYGRTNLTEEQILMIMSPEIYSKLLVFKDDLEAQLNGKFDEYRINNYDIAKRPNADIYVVQVQMIANIRSDIIVSNLIFVVEPTGKKDVPYKLQDFINQSFINPRKR